MDGRTLRAIRRRILDWYAIHQRDLPWRKTHDSYHILVSEVMLQQTQVGRVIEKYHEFLTRFPTIDVLARARASSVIKTWKGLGYNRRALFLQKTARAVVREHGGNFPRTLEELKKLPGVGDYTARAILSFAFEQSVPMMDTNHRRFYQRVFFGLAQKNDSELLVEAEYIFPKKYVYDWNQALMDFGPLVCLTRKPRCVDCPVRKYCVASPSIMEQETQNIEQKKHKKKIPFHDTDRYVRGRIIDYLREQSVGNTVQIQTLFPKVGDERFEKILQGLVRDGLVKQEGYLVRLP
ncbi:MAG: A/G-specific adenine glycosylase [Candidatus Magasanikbacteria bacterium]|nr:A/G-specific adenine glycosylase [Candidatus Magasanikbacteria bacterium]